LSSSRYQRGRSCLDSLTFQSVTATMFEVRSFVAGDQVRRWTITMTVHPAASTGSG
jgi:hypothetical protein